MEEENDVDEDEKAEPAESAEADLLEGERTRCDDGGEVDKGEAGREEKAAKD